MAMNSIEARIRRALPEVTAVSEPDRYGAVTFMWRTHVFCLRCDGYVEPKAPRTSADHAALVERLLEAI